MKMAMRKGRYRKNFLLPEECVSFAHSFFPVIREYRLQFQKGVISPAEFVASYVFEGLKIIRPKSWKGAQLQPQEAQTNLEAFQVFSFRGLPFSVNRSLIHWSQGKYELRLFFDIPSTETVLRLQSQSIRCVTCLTDFESLSRYVMNERDPLSFTVHDLIHADHFLFEPKQRQVQVGFSRWMLELWQNSDLQSALSKDSRFASQFEYACADMNSHGAHLLKYLKAIFCQAQKQDLFDELSEHSPFSLNFKKALRSLNSSEESGEILGILQEELFLKGAASPDNYRNDGFVFGVITAS